MKKQKRNREVHTQVELSMPIFWKGYREDTGIQIPEVLAGKEVACMSLERTTNSNEILNFFLFFFKFRSQYSFLKEFLKREKLAP